MSSNRSRWTKVGRAIEQHNTRLSWMRQQRTKAIRDFAGTHFGRSLLGGAAKKAMLPLCQMQAQTYSVALAYQCPRYTLTPDDPAAKAFSKNWETALNVHVTNIRLEKTLRQLAIDAFMLMAIWKTYHGDEFGGRVSPDDFVWDIGYADMRRSSFLADRYRLPMSQAQSLDWIENRAAMDRLRPSPRSQRDRSQPYAWQLTEGPSLDEGEFEEEVEFADVYYPRDNIVETWPVKGQFQLITDDGPLSTQRWREVSELGPFRKCTFIDVPDNAVPVSPYAGVRDMGLFVNALLNKVAFRAQNQKDLLMYQEGEQELAAKIQRAREIDFVGSSNPQGVIPVKMLGVDQPLYQLSGFMYGLWKEGGGNLDALLGLKATASTLGQSEMIGQRVAAREGEFKGRWTSFVSEIGEDAKQDMFDHPTLTVPARRQVGTTQYSVDATWHPPDKQERHGTADQYKCKVVPESMGYKTSEDKLQSRFGALNALAPFLGMGAQQGTTLDFRRIVEDIADLQDDPDFKSWFDYNGVPMDQAAGGGQDAPTPNDGPNGNYTRTNVSQNGGGALGQLLQQMAPAGSGGPTIGAA